MGAKILDLQDWAAFARAIGCQNPQDTFSIIDQGWEWRWADH